MSTVKEEKKVEKKETYWTPTEKESLKETYGTEILIEVRLHIYLLEDSFVSFHPRPENQQNTFWPFFDGYSFLNLHF